VSIKLHIQYVLEKETSMPNAIRQLREKTGVQAVGGPFVELVGVRKQFQLGRRTVAVLKGIDLQVRQGDFVALLGRSGSGKSTLLNMLAGLDRPSSGSVKVGGTALETLSEEELSRWRARGVGVVFQFFQLLPTLTALENVMLPMELSHIGSSQEQRRRARLLLEQMELLDQADQLPSELSGGQQQRVAIARAVANDPPLILADEPTGNLDSQSAEIVLQILSRLVGQGRTVLVVTHDRSVASYASRTIVLADGAVVKESELAQDNHAVASQAREQ
jgi:ABC-type lipoprotein export system ATPase subunit